jgi:hypothetical protein
MYVYNNLFYALVMGLHTAFKNENRNKICEIFGKFSLRFDELRIEH